MKTMEKAEDRALPKKRIGMLTPSSNTVLEPVLAEMQMSIQSSTIHFSRFPVTEISLRAQALNQFDDEPMLAAAGLLADARVHSICWNGTSAGWLGFDRDRALCAAIAQRTGIPATSSVLAIDELFRRRGVKKFGLVSPYLDDVQQRIVENFSSEGFECVAERHAKEHVNFAFATLSPAHIAAHIREVAASRPDAILVFCTNMWGAGLAAELEAELGIPILDTVATALWGSLRQVDIAPSSLKGWGELFSW